MSREDIAALPPDKGAYLLVLRLDRCLRLVQLRNAAGLLPPGWYAYAGSAHGPGGLRARLARHFRADKPHHWHIDQLTAGGADTTLALAFPGDSECRLVARLARRPMFGTAVKGFGSSDCRTCESHLLAWRE